MNTNINTTREYDLDTMKAMAISIVLYWHLQPIEYKAVATTTFWVSALSHVKHFISFQITPIAVPILLIISFQLFITKSSNDIFYIRKRLSRLFFISFFWITVQFLLFYLLQPTCIPKEKLALIVLMGGPDLPIAGGSVFYYLVILIFSVVILFVYQRLVSQHSKPINIFLIILSLIYFEYMNLTKQNLQYWRIDSFLIYVPTVLILKENIHKLRKVRFWFLAGYLIFVIQDYYLGDLGGKQSHYGRMSIYLGVIFFYLCFRKSGEMGSKISIFLSKYTLGIFALHKYWFLLFLYLLNQLYLKYHFSLYVDVISIQFNWLYFLGTILSVLFTILSAYLLSFTPLKRLVC